MSATSRNRMLCLLSLLVCCLFSATLAFHTQAAEPARKPNIILMVADDLGYGELGSYGQTKIRTPNLDRLAREGMRLSNHYSGNAVCATSRCVLMTGMHPGHAVVRDNREVKPEGQHPLPDKTVTLAELFHEAGYATGAFGKWGLGGPDSTGAPLRQGVDRFFGYNCQRVAHNYYPTYLWDNEKRLPLDNPDFAAHQKFPADLDAGKPENFQRYSGNDYAPDLIAEQALQFVRDHRDQPFLLYYPTIVPHLAIQVPDDSLAEYRGKFADEPYLGGKAYLPHPFPRAGYAAMITRMDRNVGRLLALLEELGLAEQTIFVFTSDNGPTYDRLGGSDSDYFDSADGLRGLKGSLYEGGIRVPAIVRWPGHVPAGSTSERVTGFEDWMPTLLDLAGVAKRIPKNMDGISFAATLRGEAQPPRPFLYREFPGYGGQQFVRIGDWKGIRQNLKPRGPRNQDVVVKTELYNLAEDRSESHDVAEDHPEVVAKIERIMTQEHSPSQEFPFPALDKR